MQRRHGFTLVEMLVAMALTVFIMSIVTSAFVTGLETFRQLKGIGDMQASLRTAAIRLRADLKANHFDGKKRLSDPTLWTANYMPLEGFFAILQQSASTPEGFDFDNIPSYRAGNHILYFTAKLLGNRREDFFSAQVPAGSPLLNNLDPATYFNQPSDARQQNPLFNTYSSQWAEIAYYTVKIGTTDEPNNPAGATGTPLYALYRAQRVVVPRSDQLNGMVPPVLVPPEMSGSGTAFYTPRDLAGTPTTPPLRSISPAGLLGLTSSSTLPTGSALLLDNVVSFQVQILKSSGTGFGDATPSMNAGYYGYFDTAPMNNTAHVANYSIQAISVIMRVWDPKTRQSRQISVVQDM